MKIKYICFRLVLFFLLFSAAKIQASIIATEPDSQTVSITATQGSCNEIELSFVQGNGNRRLIIARPDFPVNVVPTDGQGYFPGSIFGTGSNLGNNNFVVYNNSGLSTTITGLQGGTQYYFAIFENNGNGNNSNYLVTNYPEANAIAGGFTMSVSSSSGDMCTGDSVQLTVHGAATYQWSPSTGLSSTTDSVVWAKPNSSIQYNVQGYDNSGCSDVKQVSITVYNKPNVTLGNFSNKCENASSFTLTSGSPSGGDYSGNGITNGVFSPGAAGVGTHIITYFYSDIHGCSSQDTSTIRVLAAPNANFSTLTPVCVDASTFTLTGGTPSGGVYSGSHVSGGQFNPSAAGTGSYQIKYIYTDGSGCSDTAVSTQDVKALPAVNFSTLSPVCLNTSPFSLSGGSPSGGSYSGTGVNNSQFSPGVAGAGTFVLTYTFTDSFGCTSDDTSKLTVNTLPTVTFAAMNSVCQNFGPVTLNGGTPAGGTYTGPGVGGGVFYSGIAGPGQHTLTYTYSNNFNCTNSATRSITVNPAPHPSLGSDQLVCGGSIIHLTAGTYSSYSWSTGANTESITVDSSDFGYGTFSVTITVTNNFGCANRDTILLTFDPCNGVKSITENKDYSIYPNPSSSGFTIVSEYGNEISVYDLKGSLIETSKLSSGTFYFGENLSPGTYIVRIKKDADAGYKLITKY